VLLGEHSDQSGERILVQQLIGLLVIRQASLTGTELPLAFPADFEKHLHEPSVFGDRQILRFCPFRRLRHPTTTSTLTGATSPSTAAEGLRGPNLGSRNRVWRIPIP
jgi:hypothetical protein